MFCLFCNLIIVGLGIGFYFYKKQNSTSTPQIRETNYKKDTVYLYQFNRNSTVPTLSPFSLKTETWLRSHGIPYENRFVTSDRSSNGYLPFIELNGQIIEDSELIILKLSEYFKIEEYKTPEERAIHNGIQRLVENHLFYVMIKFKVLDTYHDLLRYLINENAQHFKWTNWLMLPFMYFFMYYKFLFRMKAVFGHFSADNFKILLKKDLDALNDFLGSKDYFGGDRMNLTDCSVFGMLASTFYLPYWNVATEMLNDDYPNLAKFMEKIRKEIWINDFTKSQ